MEFKRATKHQAKLRCGLFGPAGAGKTMSALRIGTGLGGPIAYIDTERGSASKYGDRWIFDVLELDDRSVDGYCEAIDAAAKAGYPVLAIDSLSHAWESIKDEVDRIAKAKYRGNTWSAWSEGTPLYRRFIDAILTYPGHVLATMRSATEWTVEEHNGKKTPVRIGLKPEMRPGSEFEMDLLLQLSVDHIAHVIKDRSGQFQDKLIEKPDEAFGEALAAWLSEGAAPEPRVEFEIKGKRVVTKGIEKKTLLEVWEAMRVLSKMGVDPKAIMQEVADKDSSVDLTQPEGDALLTKLGEVLAAEHKKKAARGGGVEGRADGAA